jgi:hypothetical protein
MGKWLVIAGAVLIGVGLLVWIAERAGFRGLPGDIRHEGKNLRVYFPIVSSIVLSLLLTLIVWLVQYFRQR